MTHKIETERDSLLKLYHEFNSNRIDYNKIKWGTVQFFSYLNAAFITATITIFTFIYKNEIINIPTKSILSLLPISAIAVACLGLKNLERESRLLFEQEASMFKIEKYLGFHDKIPENKRWLEGDPCLVPTKHRIVSYRACDLEGKEYLFCWDNIPGNDNGRAIEFLTQKFGIDWVKRAKIEKINGGRTIRLTDGFTQ